MMSQPLAIYVAIYGALLSTFVAAWNIYQYKTRGPKLAVRIIPNTKINLGLGGKTYTFVVVANRGTTETTVTGIQLFAFKNLLGWLRNKGKEHQVSLEMSPSEGFVLPSRLGVGQELQIFVLQDEKIESWFRDHRAFLLVSHSMSDKVFRKRIFPIPVGGDLA